MEFEEPTSGTITESEYFRRVFTQIKIALQTVHIFPIRKILPEKPKVGGVYYFAAAIPSTAITGEGLWLLKSSGWVQLG